MIRTSCEGTGLDSICAGVGGAFWPQQLDCLLVRRLPTELSGPVLIEPTVHGDHRGFFLETYRRSSLAELGIDDEFVQDNHSRSRRGVVRGMHFQPGMAKLRAVRAGRDLRRARRRCGAGRPRSAAGREPS